jgi:hypothetical protein
MHIDQTLQNEEPTYTAFGFKVWTVNGQHHRTNGPAAIWADGIQYWFINDKRYLDNKEFQIAANITDEDMTAIVLKYGNVK